MKNGHSEQPKPAAAEPSDWAGALSFNTHTFEPEQFGLSY
jgi:hypothetical protein